MIDLTELTILQPHEAEPGTLLLGGARYREPAAFIFADRDELYFFECTGPRSFIACKMADALDPYVAAGPATLTVDLESMVRPSRNAVAVGSAVLVRDEPCVAVLVNNAVRYVRVDGITIDDPLSYERVVSFARWQFIVRALAGNQWEIVHETPSNGPVA